MAKQLFFFILFFLLESLAIDAQKNGTIPVGKSLPATMNGPSWRSPSSDFEFGFHQFNSRSDLFLLAIWYVNFPDTIVWYANEGNPVPQGSTIKLTAEGLVLSNPQGILLWNTSDLTDTISYGFMNDTGNFALKNNDNEVVWESFQHPTDTLLPTQILNIGFEVDSRLTTTNFAKGRFQLRLISDGNLVLNTRELTSGYAYGAYYTAGTNTPANTPGRKLVYNESGYMYILRNDSTRFDLLPLEKTVSANDGYQRATLDFDGVLTWYYIPKTSTSGWSTIKMLPDNMCTVEGSPQPDIGSVPCGNNNICRLGSNGRPICECPQNYSLIESDDTFGSCKPDFVPDKCQGYGQGVGKKGEYTMVELQYVNWPYGDYAKLNPCSEEECRESCLDDCFCAAAIFNDENGGSCWKKKLPLSNGKRDNSDGATAWLKVGKNNYSINPFDPLGSSTPKEKNKIIALVSGLLGASIFVNLCLLSAISLGVLYIYHKKRFRWLDGGHSKSLGEYENVTSFTYQDLSKATDGFKEEIGRGAFGIVFKGIIGERDHRTLVAVKKLDRISTDAEKEFRNEVTIIGQTHHRNLVRLIGFCKEEDQRLLVYEYMTNGSLADYLFGEVKPSWLARIQIVHGIARGLLYLHEECSTQIIHCDIKPQNILLDDKYNARISDFGLAKLLGINQTQTNTAIRGTKGYVSPEWFTSKPVTVKVDVYSFGVLLLEFICCRKSVCLEMTVNEEKAIILTDWAFDCYQTGRLDSLVNDDTEALKDMQRLERFVMVALWCIQEDPSLRPSMRRVTQMLEGVAEVVSPPCLTSFTVINLN